MSTDLIQEATARGVFRVHYRVYRDEEILDRERATIFRKCWLYAGHESEIRQPGDYVSRFVADWPVVLLRDRDGRVRAFFNTCPHRGTMFCEDPSGNTQTFRCPYHGWTFNISGELIGVPMDKAYGDSFDRAAFGLIPVPRMESYRGFLFVSLDPTAEPLADYLAGTKDLIDIVCDHGENGLEVIPGAHRLTIRANWKLLAENTFDAYHVPVLHQRFFVSMRGKGPSRDVGNRVGIVRALGNGHSVQELSPSAGRPVAVWGPIYGEEVRPLLEARQAEFIARHGEERGRRITERNRVIFIFPNLFIMDGNGGITLRLFFAAGAHAMHVTSTAMAPVGETPELRKLRMDGLITWYSPASIVMPDDGAMLEACQRTYTNTEAGWCDNSRGFFRAGERETTTDELQDELCQRVFWREWRRRMAS